MRMPIQLRISLTILFVLLLGMGLAAGFAWLSVEQLFLTTLRENLLAQAELTAAAFQGTPLSTADTEPYLQTANIQPGIHTRLVGDQGGVVISLPIMPNSTNVRVPQAENTGYVSPEALRQREEIKSALQGNPASAVRRVTAVGSRRVLYAAAPVFSETGEITGIVYLATPLPPALLPVNIILQLAGAVGIAILVAGMVGIILSHRISRPIESLFHAANAVASGNLEQKVPVDTNIRELHILGQAFNDMTDNLRHSELAKNAFIADVTHELRTPLTVIKGTVETLEDGALDDPEARGPMLTAMHQETDRLIRLVNDLLVLARADAGVLNLKIQSIDLVALVQSRISSLSVLAAPHGVKLAVEAEDSLRICGDVDRLSQVLDNLLDNAIRYAPVGTIVKIAVRRDVGEVQCSVIDQGPGISAQHLPFIFERFYRVEPSRKRLTGGSGLGLAIVHSLVLAQGGRVNAHSIEGQGTMISFWLPSDENCPKTA